MAVPAQPPFTAAVRQIGSTAEITVAGELDISTVAELEAALDDAFGLSPERVLVDLREIGFIDSTGLRCLIETKRRRETRTIDVVVLRPPPPVDRPFEICGLDEDFPPLSAVTPLAAGHATQPSYAGDPT